MDDLIEEVIISNFSLYEWMNMEKLLIGLDHNDLTLISDLPMDELETIIGSLVKRGILETKIENKETFYKKIFKKSLKSKVLGYLK